jgi:arsenate reductase
MIKIYHNPRCRKSREALHYLEDSGRDFEVVLYLKESISISELSDLLAKLDMSPIDLVRKEESLWKTQYRDKNLSNVALIDLMIQEPRLMQRPIIVSGNKAIVARPPETIKQLF